MPASFRSRTLPVSRALLCAGSAAALVVVGVTGPAAAAPGGGENGPKLTPRSARSVTVTGKVAHAQVGMWVVGLQTNGKAKKVKLTSSRAFSLKVLAAGTTFHVINNDGSYVGPIILRGNGRRGKITSTLDYAQLKAGAKKTVKLGTVNLASGFAKVAAPVPAKYVYTGKAQSSVAVAGKPVGAGKLGRVLVPASAALRAPNRPWVDLDRDGFPGAFDVDDDGDRILDNVDRSTRQGSVRAAGGLSGRGLVGTADSTTDGFTMFSNYKATQGDLGDVLNINVAPITESDLNQSMVQKLSFAMQVLAGSPTLSCTGEVYCDFVSRPIIAGQTQDFQWQVGQEFPALLASDVQAGQTFIETTSSGDSVGMLNMIFNTTPALKSYQLLDDAGSPDGAPVTVDWSSGSIIGGVGNPVDLTGHHKIQLEVYRPQRAALSGEANVGGYVDIGGMRFSADAHPGFCAMTAGDADGQTAADGGSTVVWDKSIDAAPSATETISLIVDTTACGNALSQTFDFDIQVAGTHGDNSATKLYFQR